MTFFGLGEDFTKEELKTSYKNKLDNLINYSIPDDEKKMLKLAYDREYVNAKRYLESKNMHQLTTMHMFNYPSILSRYDMFNRLNSYDMFSNNIFDRLDSNNSLENIRNPNTKYFSMQKSYSQTNENGETVVKEYTMENMNGKKKKTSKTYKIDKNNNIINLKDSDNYQKYKLENNK